MRHLFKIIIITSILLAASPAAAQQRYEQSVRGLVRAKDTSEPLAGALVIVFNGKEFGAVSDGKGEFAVAGVPVGRCRITVTMLGFTPHISNSVLVYSGKETVLDIAMEENISELAEITVTPKVDKEMPLNKLATVSARMLSSEEAHRYAGTIGDPSRMVASFAGVIAANDTRNDIIIRGNSPMGLLWRLDGFDIPNPNHFGAMGGTGGPIGMLNNNQLANSDFYTGAFPAEFGNATSGVFDLRLRNGNSQRHEFLLSASMNGFELGAEGPLWPATGASYMINGRYSFLGILKSMGIEFYGGSVPEYQDVCAKVNVPLKHGSLSWIALLGASQIHDEPDFNNGSTEWVEGDRASDLRYRNGQIFTGVNYTHRFNAAMRLENRLSYQLFRHRTEIDDVVYPNTVNPDWYGGNDQEARIACSSTLFSRISARSLLKGGIGADVYVSDIYNRVDSVVLNNYRGNSCLLKGFAQWLYRFSDVLSMTPGVYGQLYTLNGDVSVEPRIGFKYTVSPSVALTLGSGLFSQLQPRQVYIYEEDGILPNRNLKMSKSWQHVLGYSQKIGEGMRLKTEIYYQSLFSIPVIPAIPEESILNMGDDYYNNWDYRFVNSGTGRNYGAEITLEKFFDKTYYFLLTASLFDSRYRGSDGVERYSKFAGHYAFNGLFGYEWKIGSRHLLSANVKMAYVGGKRYVPMSVTTVSDYNYVYDYTQAYTRKLPDYFRADLNINMKINFRRLSVEWFAEINNITNHKNIWMRYFSSSHNREEYMYQYGFMPIGGCRVYFMSGRLK